MTQERIDIIYNSVFNDRGTRRAERSIRRVDQTAGRSGQSFANLAGKVALVTGALGVVATAAGVAYKAINEGAELELARGRFDNLAETIGTTGDVLLGKMKDATQGMRSEAELVAAGLELMNGKLVASEDAAIRMSTVAGTLNWDMGVLAQTINNQSVLRLDNLGLAVEDVIPRFKELRDQMSDKEAFALAVIEAGEEKIEIFGEASTTAAGKIDILKSRWDNLINGIKTGAVELAEPIIIDVAIRVTEAGPTEQDYREIEQDLQARVNEFSSRDEFVAEFRADFAPAYLEGVFDRGVLNDIRNYGSGLEELNQQSRALFNQERTASIEQQRHEHMRYGESLEELSRVGRAAFEEQQAAEEAYRQRVEDNADATVAARERQIAAVEEYNIAMGARFDAAVATPYEEMLINNPEAQAQALYDAASGADAMTKALLGIDLGLFTEEQAKAALKSILLREKLEELAEQIEDPGDIPGAIAEYNSYRDELDNVEGDLQDVIDQTGVIRDETLGLDGTRIRIDVDTYYNEYGNRPPGAGTGGQSSESGGYTGAGDFATGTAMLTGPGRVGEFSGELILGRGERVVSTNQTRNITNNLNFTGRAGQRALLSHFRRQSRPRNIVA